MSSSPAPGSVSSDELRRRLGAFYTPSNVVSYMISRLKGLSPKSLVLEPSGGDGAFVYGLLSAKLLATSNIEVWDINPDCKPQITALGVPFVEKDALLSPAVISRYTHVIGNPPYLNKQSSYIKANRLTLKSRYREIGANDTYAMFIYMALKALIPGGQLVFLVSDTFLTLGIHKKLRELLLAASTIDEITLLPPDVFTDASVNTAIISLRATPAPDAHQVSFYDLRDLSPLHFPTTPTSRVSYSVLRKNHASVFAFTKSDLDALKTLSACPPLLDLLDGGLGMYTKDNQKYLARVDYTSSRPAPGYISHKDVDAKTWLYYHKRGGTSRWYAPAEHAVRWDASSRAGYGMPKSALSGLAKDLSPRPGFIVSGVSSRLSARLITPGAMWESNKAFGFFPKDPLTYPPEFFIAILNSSWYDRLASTLNHTVSLQIRDLKALPLLPFTKDERLRLVSLAASAIAKVKHSQDPVSEQASIDQLVDAVAARLLK